MIVLTLEPGEAEKLAEGAPTLQRRYGMPIAPAPYRLTSRRRAARLPRPAPSTTSSAVRLINDVTPRRATRSPALQTT
jgi:hypothetical protein